MIARMETKPSSTNSHRITFALAMNLSMAEPRDDTYGLKVGSVAPHPDCVSKADQASRTPASGHFPVREQPEDNAECDQTDETVPAHVLHPGHDVRCYSAEERQIGADQQGEHDRQCQQHKS